MCIVKRTIRRIKLKPALTTRTGVNTNSNEKIQGVTSNIYTVRDLHGREIGSPPIPTLCISYRPYESASITDKQAPKPSLGGNLQPASHAATRRWIFLIVGCGVGAESITQIRNTLSVIENSSSDVRGVFTYCW